MLLKSLNVFYTEGLWCFVFYISAAVNPRLTVKKKGISWKKMHLIHWQVWFFISVITVGLLTNEANCTCEKITSVLLHQYLELRARKQLCIMLCMQYYNLVINHIVPDTAVQCIAVLSSGHYQTTWHYNWEDNKSIPYSHRCENLKSSKWLACLLPASRYGIVPSASIHVLSHSPFTIILPYYCTTYTVEEVLLNEPRVTYSTTCEIWGYCSGECYLIPCSLVDKYQCFRGICCLHLQGRTVTPLP
jgi:hypothetical protein